MCETQKQSGKIFDLIKKPLLMGILNITPDSFSDGRKYFKLEDAIDHAKKLIDHGVDIIDVGGESTRPYAKPVSEEEEIRRVIPIIKELAVIARSAATKQSADVLRNEIASSPLRAPRNDAPTHFLISIDTYKSRVAQKALEAGANIINDVSGLTKDLDMVHVARKFNCPIVIMHNKGIPATKPEVNCHPEQSEGSYNVMRSFVANAPQDDIAKEVYNWLQNQTNFALSNGVRHENIIIDPGIGFGKSAEEDLYLIENIQKFKSLGFLILVGISRKSFIRKLFPEYDIEKKSRELEKIAVKTGADIVRLHAR